MPRVAAAVPVGDVERARALWYDTRRWPSFVDGCKAVVRRDPEWPEAGRVIWHSTPAGQGQTRERIVGPGVVEVETERHRGRRTDVFAEGELRVTLDYELKVRVPGFWVRRQLQASLERTLRRFAIELADG